MTWLVRQFLAAILCFLREENSHTTSYSYDQRGRTLPLRQTESYTYHANGNLATGTDFNGRVTTYGYPNRRRYGLGRGGP